MSLTRLDVSDFRNLSSVKLEPVEAGFNLIYGNNGSGKTSLLESIYYLSFGRSFRSISPEHIIRNSTDKFSIFANLTLSNNHRIPLGIERQKQGDLKIRLDGADASSIADLAKLLPIQLMNSHCYNLLDAGPTFRRKYLDWGIFYLNPDFLSLWRNYKRILKQRNAALQQSVSTKEIHAWSNKLIEYALQLDAWRKSYVEELLPRLRHIVSQLLPRFGTDPAILGEITVNYLSGWKQGVSYQDVLVESLNRDLQLGYTQFGPHRADLRITVNRLSAKDILSRGQQKLFVCAMILAQGELLHKRLNRRPIYLVDDLPSELDLTSRSNLITLLSKQEAQVFVTAVERGIFDECVTGKPVKLFHVEHGNLTSIAE